jgi:hypothetical protein
MVPGSWVLKYNTFSFTLTSVEIRWDLIRHLFTKIVKMIELKADRSINQLQMWLKRFMRGIMIVKDTLISCICRLPVTAWHSHKEKAPGIHKQQVLHRAWKTNLF